MSKKLDTKWPDGKSKSWLLVGGHGFIGQNLHSELMRRGEISHPWDIALNGDDGLDLTPEILEDYDVVVNLAAVSGIPACDEDLETSFADNVRLPYHLSSVTQAVARVALAHADELQRDIARLRASRDALVAWLGENGFDVPASDANFVLVGPFRDRHAVWEALLGHGVLVREVGPPQWLRVTVGTDDEMDRFRDALLAVTEREATT